MAMCASGSIGILSAPQGGCSSISLASCGTTAAPQCLIALGSATDKNLPVAMSAFYGYNDSLVITPTTISAIPNICTTCCVTTCAPTFNTATVSSACTWLVPVTPITPTPTGNTHNIVICANTGAARCGTVTYTPTCGSSIIVTLCQVASGVSPKCVQLVYQSGSGCGTSTIASYLYGIVISPAMAAGECFCLCLGGVLNTANEGASSCANYVVNCTVGVYCYSCNISANVCATPSPSYSIMITNTNNSCVCLCLCAQTTAGCHHSCAFGNIISVTSVAGCFNIGPASFSNICTC